MLNRNFKQALKLLTIIFSFCFFVSCSKKKDDPLIIPPNFAEKPDPNNPEQPTEEQRSANIAKLKELLLKTDE